MENTNSSNGFFIKGKDGKEIFVYCWDKVSEPKAVVQIFHGMAEHAGRYKRFAEYLNSKGYIVYADDHRGHGKTAGCTEELGCIGEDGFNKIVEDEHSIKELIEKKHKNLPIIVFGHSFGSFLAQEYIIRYGSEINGAVMCGSAARTGPEIAIGKAAAYIQKGIFGERRKAEFIEALTFGSYNRRIKDSKSKVAWISSDAAEVRQYEEAPFCGTIFSVGFYYYLFKAFSKLYKKERLAKIPQDLPIFIIAGEEDPVGGYGKLVKKLYKIYKSNRIKDVQLKLYSGDRHEILNEVNRNEVFSDISDWIEKVIK